MLRTTTRGTHRADGPAVVDYRALLSPLAKGATGAAAFTAVAATAATGFPLAPADAAPSTNTVAPSAKGAVPTTGLGTKTLRTGDRGATVKALQTALNAKGASIAVDGIFGSATRSAVMSLQSAAGITVDGVVGPATRAALGGDASVAAASNSDSGSRDSAPAPSASATTSLVRQGSRGEAVKTLQTKLNEKGASLSVDGIFGSGTATALRAFQSSAGLTADGIAGPKTWAALNGSEGSAAAPAASSAPREERAAVSATILRPGMKGASVKDLQDLLNKRGAGIVADGEYGRATTTAVRAFQRAAGLGVDGIAGPATISALQSDSNVTIEKQAPAAKTTPVVNKKSAVKGNASDAAIIATAEQFYGVPYVWGGSTPAGFDCSGFTRWVYKQNGIDVPRTARQQAFAGRMIPRSEARVGDLVVFPEGNYGHIGIYAGDGMIIDAGSSPKSVTKRKIWTSNVIFVTYR